MSREFDRLWETLSPALQTVHPSSTIGRAATQVAPSTRTLEAVLPLISFGQGGDFELRERIGEGGMGVVSVALQRSLRREVAVKTVRPSMAGHAPTQGLLLREAAIAGALEHPNIVPVHLLGRDEEGLPILVMKRVVGVPWDVLIADDDHSAFRTYAWLDTDRLRAHLEILMQVSNALGFAHAHGVLHRDIKPENVLVGAYGEVHLADWGVAAHVDDLAFEGLVGTPQFLAPELVDPSLPQGPWTDVYLLGATLHAVLTGGGVRHQGATLHAVLLSAWQSEPFAYPSSVPVELAKLANRATSRDPKDRPQSAAAFRQGLADHLTHRASIALSQTARARLDECPRSFEVDGDLDRAFRIATEARFGFLTAQREWPASAEAQAGLDDAMLVLVRVEIERGNLAAARAYLAEMRGPSVEVRDAVDALEARLAAQREEAEKLRSLARDIDPAFTSGARLALLMVVVAMGVLVAVFARPDATPADLDGEAKRLVYIIAGLLGAVAGVTWIGRKRLFQNAAGRRVTVALILTMGAMLVNRSVGWIDGRAVAATLRGDMLLGALGLTLVGLFAARPWLAGGALLTLSAALSVVWPAHAGDLFGAFATLSLALVALLDRYPRRRRE